MVVIGMGWLLLVGGVVIASRWCKGPGARPPLLSMPFRKELFWGILTRILVVVGVEKKVRILTIPLCWGPPGCLPRHFLKIRYF